MSGLSFRLAGLCGLLIPTCLKHDLVWLEKKRLNHPGKKGESARNQAAESMLSGEGGGEWGAGRCSKLLLLLRQAE